MISLSQAAKNYASERHTATNHTYDDKPYAFHLQMVAEAADSFSQSYDPATREVIIAAAWCHDVIEDARETYNDVKKVLGEEVAEIVYALTNDKGRTRTERAGEKYYAGIRQTPYATLVKLCDRIANVRHSRQTAGRMLAIYQKEYPLFRSKLYVAGEFEEAWQALENLLQGNVRQ
ncbi:MAG: HD domain-containing protein [Bacteroidota bacterium]